MMFQFLASVLSLTVFVHSLRINSNTIQVNTNPEPHEVVRRSNPGNDQPEIDVVYLTPSNIDTMLDFIQPPNWKEIKHRRKPFTIFVEGIVGTGKTTFLQSFQTFPVMDILPEPVSKWTNLNGTDLLQLVYSNPYRWALTQESYVQLTMLEEHLQSDPSKLIKAMERSIHSARYVFNEEFYQSGKMKDVEYALLDSWYKFLTDKYTTGFDLDGDLIFYLQSDPVVVMDRIKKRGRPEESTISLEFLEGLNRLHEDWLIHRNTTTDAPIPSKNAVFVINTNHNYFEMQKMYSKIAQHLYRMIPSEYLQFC